MLTQIAWRSDLPIAECEQRLGNMPKRLWLVTSAKVPVIVARPSGRMFRLFVSGAARRVLFAPYFHGFLIDRHGATEIRGRIFPAPLTQSVVFVCALALLLFVIGAVRGVLILPATMIPLALIAIWIGVATAGWRSGRQGSTLIATSIEGAFDAHRLTNDSSRRRAI
jgi:hypothetical protein